MENPLAKTELFATPDSVRELQEYINAFNGGERVVATTAANMAWNLASKIVNESIKKEETA